MRPLRRLLPLASILLAGTSLVAPASPANADAPATLYVDVQQHCSDSGLGTQALPYCSIQAAEAVAVPGQTVAIAGGMKQYGPLTITRSGTATAPITFTWYGSTSPWVTGTVTIAGAHDIALSGIYVGPPDDQPAIQISGASHVTLNGMVTTHTSAQAESDVGVAIDGGSSDVTVSRTMVTGGEGVFLQAAPGASHITVTTNRITSWGPAAISLNGVLDAAVTSNSIITRCGSAIVIGDGSTAAVENNAVGLNTDRTCTAVAAGLSVSADSTGGVRSDYNAYHAAAPAVADSWGGTTYPSVGDFHSAIGQAAHDLDLTATPPQQMPAAGSPLLDSADADAPGELPTDVLGNPRVDDPQAANAGVGASAPDRGAYEREDGLTLTDTIAPSPAQAVAPFPVTVTATSATSSWSEPVTFTADFGDGSTSAAFALGETASHTYQTPGVYTETTTVTDSSGSRESTTHTVTVGTPTPAAVSLTFKPDVTEFTNGEVHLTPGTAILDASYEAGWEIGSVNVDWGDGGGNTYQGATTEMTHAYSTMGSYTARLTVTDLFGRTSTATTTVTVGDGFFSPATDPVRAYDSRDGGGIDKVPASGVVKLSLAQLDADQVGVDAAVVNVTVTNPKASGFIAVYPDGAPIPATSNVDYAAGQSVANHVVALAGADGYVDFYNHSTGPVDLIVDSYGYLQHDVNTSVYSPVAPARLLDTRTGLGGTRGPVASKGSLSFQVAGTNGIPADADEAVINLTATDTTSAGYVTAYGYGGFRPGTSNADWAAGQTVSALAVLPLPGGKVTLYNSGPGTANFLADVVGFYHEEGLGSVFLPAQPQRLLDTRSGLGTNGQIAKLQPGQTITLPVAPHVNAPAAGVSAVEVNLTATNASSTGYITAYPHGGARGGTSSLDFAGGQTAANMAITPVGADGAIDLYNGGGATVDLLVDLYGAYYRYPSS